MEFDEHSSVILDTDAYDVPFGTRGTVIHIYPSTPNIECTCEVEFHTPTGSVVLTVAAKHLVAGE